MGRYIDDILQPGEKVLYATTLHWIVYLKALLAWIVAGICLIATRWAVADQATLFLLAVAVIVGLVAAYWSFRAWFRRWTTETDVTNLRVVHKEGFIKRQTFEMSMDKIESVDVYQSIAGRLFGYGDVCIHGVGDSTKDIRMIASPIEFRNNITAR
jgi:uncharacterized membrane protein YdbT with pleckstrin-like domain